MPQMRSRNATRSNPATASAQPRPPWACAGPVGAPDGPEPLAPAASRCAACSGPVWVSTADIRTVIPLGRGALEAAERDRVQRIVGLLHQRLAQQRGAVGRV